MSENGRQFSPRGPVDIAAAFNESSQNLSDLSNLLQEAHEMLEETEAIWLAHYDAVMADLEAGDERMPGEDLRLSMARRAEGGRKKWDNWRKAEHLAKKIDKQSAQTRALLSALQSEAKLLMAA